MESILESEGQYYNSAPTFSNFGFDDETALDDGWYQMDSYTGAWTSLFADVSGKEWNSDGWAIPGFAALSEGSHTIYFKADDVIGNVEGESGEWSWQFHKDTTDPNQVTGLSSTSHIISTWSNDNTVDVVWTAATDPGSSGLDGYSVLWDNSPTTLPDTVKDIEQTATTATSSTLADGNSHYFHIRSVDNAGNWDDTAAHLGPFYIDTTPPSSSASSPASTTSTSFTVSWSGTDGHSGIASYDVQYKDGAGGAWTDWQTATTATSAIFTGQSGHTYYFQSRARDNAGNVEGYPGGDGDTLTSVECHKIYLPFISRNYAP
jgi:hypothetical protein